MSTPEDQPQPEPETTPENCDACREILRKTPRFETPKRCKKHRKT